MDKFECSAKSFTNFLRVDDEDNEIVVKTIDKDSKEPEHLEPSPQKDAPLLSRKEKLDMLRAMIKNIENLPTGAMMQPINHYDHCSALVLLLSILDEG